MRQVTIRKLASALRKVEDRAKYLRDKRDENEIKWNEIQDKIKELGAERDVQVAMYGSEAGDGFYNYGDVIC